jgi:eukaryotic-like serine/threonine-protein kinase
VKACPACNSRYDDNTTYCVKDGSPVVPDVLSPNAPMIGQLIGDRYKIIKKIGEGGMGEVYLAEHIHIEKRVALKLLRAEVLSNQEAVQRFRQEARSASSIGHENIIQIDDFGTLPDGRVYMAMEFLQGEPLNDMLAKGPLAIPRALDIMIQTARGLSAAHAKNITHRDMKPENIFVVNKDGREIPKILDFGIAKVSGGDTSQNLTVAGTIFGTPFYMSPEQAMGGKMDHRCDVYAMGIILYEVFCGTVPFKAETFMGILTQHITMQAVPPATMAAQNGRACPPELEAIILKAIEKDPNRRYQSMQELTNALIEFYRFAFGAGAMTAAPWANRGSASMSLPYATTGPRSAQHGAQGGRKPWVLPVIIGSVVLVGGGIAAVVIGTGGGGKDNGTGQHAAVADAGGGGKVVVTPKPTIDAAVATAPKAPDAGTGGQLASATPDAATTGGGNTQHQIDPPPQEHKPKPGEIVVVKLRSNPPGAIVKKAGHYECQTPCDIEVKYGEKAKYNMTLEGYNSQSVTLDGTKSSTDVRLVKGELHPVNPELHQLDDDLAPPKNN